MRKVFILFLLFVFLLVGFGVSEAGNELIPVGNAKLVPLKEYSIFDRSYPVKYQVRLPYGYVVSNFMRNVFRFAVPVVGGAFLLYDLYQLYQSFKSKLDTNISTLDIVRSVNDPDVISWCGLWGFSCTSSGVVEGNKCCYKGHTYIRVHVDYRNKRCSLNEHYYYSIDTRESQYASLVGKPKYTCTVYSSKTSIPTITLVDVIHFGYPYNAEYNQKGREVVFLPIDKPTNIIFDPTYLEDRLGTKDSLDQILDQSLQEVPITNISPQLVDKSQIGSDVVIVPQDYIQIVPLSSSDVLPFQNETQTGNFTLQFDNNTNTISSDYDFNYEKVSPSIIEKFLEYFKALKLPIPSISGYGECRVSFQGFMGREAVLDFCMFNDVFSQIGNILVAMSFFVSIYILYKNS
ncbi:MAG: hypothetical protein ACP5H3_03275 [Candidatus Aenigmatarchaeota archaeon]